MPVVCAKCEEELVGPSCPGCDGEEIARLKDELHEANERLAALDGELRLTRGEVVAQARAKEEALAEAARLREGRFTEEEFQALCHTLSPADRVCRFRQGCQAYQVSLFGESAVMVDLAREVRWALRMVSFAHGLDALAEAVAEAIVGNGHLKPPCADAASGGGRS